MAAQISAEHMEALKRGASFREVAKNAGVHFDTLRRRYLASGGKKHPMGPRPQSDAVKASVILAIRDGAQPKAVAIDHGISPSTVSRIVRAARATGAL